MKNKIRACIADVSKQLTRKRMYNRKRLESILKVAGKSQRFVHTGFTVDVNNPELTKLPVDYNLPFPAVTIEFDKELTNVIGYDVLFLARSTPKKELKITPFIFMGGNDGWICMYHNFVIQEVIDMDGKISHPMHVEYFGAEEGRNVANVEWVKSVGSACALSILYMNHMLSSRKATIELISPVRDKVGQKTGKPLKMDSYHALVLTEESKVMSATGGGTHASPREHVRRGHWRTSKYGIRHWVNSCTVKEGSEYKVNKDYILSKEKQHESSR